MRDADVLASVELARSRRDRMRGLLGRDAFEGALLLQPARSVHTLGMRFAIDVAFCDADLTVLVTRTMQPNRIGGPVWRARCVLEAEAGRFYPCVAYDGPGRDLLHSPLASRIGVVERLRTGLRDPGVGDAPWIVRAEQMRAYLAGRPAQTVDAKLVERMCVALLPRSYKTLYPARAGVTEFYLR